MKIKVYRSGNGDCLLIESADGKRILADGGVPKTYERHIAEPLGSLRDNGEHIDVAYVSHIDRDHIGGILAMLDNEVAWRVFDFQTQQGRDWDRPDRPRPPEIAAIWHNAFFDDVTKNTPDAVDILARTGSVFAYARDQADLVAAAEQTHFLGQSVGDAIEVTRRIGEAQLGIPLNPEFDGKFMVRKSAAPDVTVGSIDVHVLAPTKTELEKLRREWNGWLDDKKDYLARLLRPHERDEARLPSEQPDTLLRVAERQAIALSSSHGVTPPNLASLVVLLEENGTRALMTGDAADETIIDGLKALDLIDGDDGIHVDVLKVPHHGADNSYSDTFADTVIADHYVFCGDGHSHNPEPDVIDGYLRARLGRDGAPSPHPKAGEPFTFWFNCSSALSSDSHRDFWQAHEDKLTPLMADSSGRFTVNFLTQGDDFDVL